MMFPPAFHSVGRSRVLLIIGVFAVFFLLPYVAVAALNECFPAWVGLPLVCSPAGSLALLALYVVFVRRTILKRYLSGRKLLEEGEYQAAMEAFQAHYDAVAKFPRLDRWPWLALVDVEGLTHREIALMAMAYTALQIGDYDQALALYRRCVSMNPENATAMTVLRLLDADAEPAGPSS